VDNGSSDGTDKELAWFRYDKRVRWTRDESPWNQSAVTSELAREAYRLGADWIVPIDADEFWYARNYNFRQLLSETRAAALKVQVINFIQSRHQVPSFMTHLLSMTARVSNPIGPYERCKELVESNQIAYVEMIYPPKFLCRASPDVVFSAGNHKVSGVEGPFEEGKDLSILHAPIRTRATLEKKAEHGRRHDEVGKPPEIGWHVRRFARLQEECGLDEEWEANSYADGFLDVYGSRRSVVFDPTLRDTLSPIINTLARTGLNRHDKY
jgi:glycosyltransferase involved in cell wall biosynthesis